jgi:uncharacterized protein
MQASIATTDDPVLHRLRGNLDASFGDRLERVILYGSRARGDANAHSDYDVAVFLRDMRDRWGDLGLLATIETQVFDDTGALVHAVPLRAGSWVERTPLMGAIRRDGIDL